MWKIIRKLLLAAAACSGAFALERVMSLGIPLPVLIGISLALGVAGYFGDKLWHRFGSQRSFRLQIYGMLLLLFVLWLGWPWPKVASFFVSQGEFLTQKWMSEIETEQFVIEKLCQEQVGDVYLQRVRKLIVWRGIGQGIDVRYRQAGDSNWLRLGWLKADTLFSIISYDGTERLTFDTDYEVEYLTEQVRMWSWVKHNENMRFRDASPKD